MFGLTVRAICRASILSERRQTPRAYSTSRIPRTDRVPRFDTSASVPSPVRSAAPPPAAQNSLCPATGGSGRASLRAGDTRAPQRPHSHCVRHLAGGARQYCAHMRCPQLSTVSWGWDFPARRRSWPALPRSAALAMYVVRGLPVPPARTPRHASACFAVPRPVLWKRVWVRDSYYSYATISHIHIRHATIHVPYAVRDTQRTTYIPIFLALALFLHDARS